MYSRFESPNQQRYGNPSAIRRERRRSRRPATEMGERVRTTFRPLYDALNISTVDWNFLFIVITLVVGVAIFAVTVAGFAMVLTHSDNVNELATFSRNLINDFLPNQCSVCTAPNLTYLERGVNPVEIQLRGDALGITQFQLGYTTPCEFCNTTAVPVPYTLQANASEFGGPLLVDTGFLSADRFHTTQLGVTYDALSLWIDALNFTAPTFGGVSNLTSAERCTFGTLGAVYTVISSASTSVQLCCDYYLCTCALNASAQPNEYCTHQLLNTNSSIDQPRLNCVNGTGPGGCSCADPIC